MGSIDLAAKRIDMMRSLEEQFNQELAHSEDMVSQRVEVTLQSNLDIQTTFGRGQNWSL